MNSARVDLLVADIQFQHNCSYSSALQILYCGWNCGFFSNCSVTLSYLINLYLQNIAPCKIDFSRGFSYFKTPTQIEKQEDTFKDYFTINSEVNINLGSKVLVPNHHGIYNRIDFSQYNPFIQKYFSLSPAIVELKGWLIDKYQVCLSKTLVVFYRGTDKDKEVHVAPYEMFIQEAEKILQKYPDFRVLIQTDQSQVRLAFKRHFADKCFYFEELPVTSGKLVMHKCDLQQLEMDKFEFGRRLLAVTHLISTCHTIITHTGNMGLWVCLFRGNSHRVIQQFQEFGMLSPSMYSLITSYYVKRLLRRLKRPLNFPQSMATREDDVLPQSVNTQ